MSLPSIDAFTSGNFFSACTAAFTKNDMKPSFTPCSFSNLSLYLLRRSITGAMLTSLNVVRMALVLLRLEQTLGDARAQARHRHALLRAVLQPLVEPMPAPSRPAATAGGLRCGSAGRRGGLAAGAPAASTSPLVMRPSRPVPATSAGDTPFSASSLPAAGEAAVFAPAADAACAAGAGSGSRRRAAGAGFTSASSGSGGARALRFGVDLGDDLDRR